MSNGGDDAPPRQDEAHPSVTDAGAATAAAQARPMANRDGAARTDCQSAPSRLRKTGADPQRLVRMLGGIGGLLGAVCGAVFAPQVRGNSLDDGLSWTIPVGTALGLGLGCGLGCLLLRVSMVHRRGARSPPLLPPPGTPGDPA